MDILQEKGKDAVSFQVKKCVVPDDVRLAIMENHMPKMISNDKRSNCPSVSSEDFIAVDDDNVRTSPIMADKDILKFVQCCKSIIDADSDDENEMKVQVLFSPHPK
ncbi:hypothetical protein TNCV_3235191 [Trichonephila clavipes]|nr:hypothetical protein TNCV_3235191 [Trichonephila clavipes]